MASALIIVWRESVEAILVVAILYAWLRNNDARAGLRWLGYGVLGGLAVAAALGGAMVALHGSFEWLETIILFVAALLIVQMVGWMRQHGRTLKHDLETGAHKAVISGNFAGLALLAAIAVAREGAETVLFLYGLVVEQSGAGLAAVGAGAALGIAPAIATFWLLSSGARWISWPVFFRASEILLLVFASTLVVGGVGRLLDMGVLEAGAPLWDSAWLVDRFELGAWLAYWALALAWLNRARLLKYA